MSRINNGQQPLDFSKPFQNVISSVVQPATVGRGRPLNCMENTSVVQNNNIHSTMMKPNRILKKNIKYKK